SGAHLGERESRLAQLVVADRNALHIVLKALGPGIVRPQRAIALQVLDELFLLARRASAANRAAQGIERNSLAVGSLQQADCDSAITACKSNGDVRTGQIILAETEARSDRGDRLLRGGLLQVGLVDLHD